MILLYKKYDKSEKHKYKIKYFCRIIKQKIQSEEIMRERMSNIL